MPFAGSLLGLAKALVGLPNSDLSFRSYFTFAASHVLGLCFPCSFLLH